MSDRSSGGECFLNTGDLIGFAKSPSSDSATAEMKVVASGASSCTAGDVAPVRLTDLQEILALLGAGGYWGWSNKVAADEAGQKLVAEAQARKSAEEAASKLAGETQRRVAAEKVADAAEVAAAQALLDKHIAAEEAEAMARARTGPGPKPKVAPVRR